MHKYFLGVAIAIAMSSASAQDAKIGVSNLQTAQVGPIYSITGIATNLTPKLIKTAFIKFNLYDDQGNLVGNTVTMASQLEARGTWKFKADSPTHFASFKVSEVSTFDN